MKECASKCYIHHVPCSQRECRLHLDYEEDLNCVDIAIDKNGAMKLRQVAERCGVTTARAQQIEKAALPKLKKLM